MKTILMIDGLIIVLAGAVQAGLPGLSMSEVLRGYITFALTLVLVAAKYIETTMEIK